MTVKSVRPPADNDSRPADESAEFVATEAADAAGELDAVGALDVFAPDATLGTLHRFRVDSSMMRYAARLGEPSGDGDPARLGADRRTRQHSGR